MSIRREDVYDKARQYTAAWNSHDAGQVAAHFAGDGEIVINRGTPLTGNAEIIRMAAQFYADVPVRKLTCDSVRLEGNHAVYKWTFTGHHADTRNPLSVSGWEEWDLNDDLTILRSRGWFDAADYARQIDG